MNLAACIRRTGLALRVRLMRAVLPGTALFWDPVGGMPCLFVLFFVSISILWCWCGCSRKIFNQPSRNIRENSIQRKRRTRTCAALAKGRVAATTDQTVTVAGPLALACKEKGLASPHIVQTITQRTDFVSGGMDCCDQCRTCVSSLPVDPCRTVPTWGVGRSVLSSASPSATPTVPTRGRWILLLRLHDHPCSYSCSFPSHLEDPIHPTALPPSDGAAAAAAADDDDAHHEGCSH